MKEGESISKKSAMGGQVMGKIITKNCSGSLRTSSKVIPGKHYKIIGNCIRRNIMQEVIIKMMTYGHPKKNSVASDKDDWKIDMPDADEIDDIEKESVNDDSQPPRTRV